MDEDTMNSDPTQDCFAYDHEAMNTTFNFRLLGMDEESARSLAQLCLEKVDQLEGKLSRYQESSDVSRINALPAGETLYISEETHRCLLLGVEAAGMTHGLFDITIGSRIEHRKSGGDGEMPALRGRLKIHPDVAAVSCEEEGRQIDLGGIGKGFALDELRPLLEDWQAGGALLMAGASSMLAQGDGSWPIELGGKESGARIELEGRCLSASATDMQGNHLLHPWGEDAMPAEPCERVWVVADSAAVAEVWSTALMLLDPLDFEEALQGATGVHEVYYQRLGRISRVR